MILGAAGPLAAHPHIWFESQIILQPAAADGGGASGTTYRIGFEWTFDAMFTEMIVSDFDENRDRTFSAAEIRSIRAEAFSNLRHYDYFVTLRQGERRSVPSAIEEFSAFLEGDRLVYRFFVKERLSGEFGVTVFDDSYYCAIDYADPPLVAEGLATGSLSVEVHPAEGRVARYQSDHRLVGILGGNETAYGNEVVIRPPRR